MRKSCGRTMDVSTSASKRATRVQPKSLTGRNLPCTRILCQENMLRVTIVTPTTRLRVMLLARQLSR